MSEEIFRIYLIGWVSTLAFAYFIIGDYLRRKHTRVEVELLEERVAELEEKIEEVACQKNSN